jgi:hypothetical protein
MERSFVLLALIGCGDEVISKPDARFIPRPSFDGGGDSGVAPPLCPPSAPFGVSEGNVLPDVSFPDCDGASHSLHELCERQASWIYVFAGW